MFITAFELMLVIVAGRNATVLRDAPRSAMPAMDVQQRDTTRCSPPPDSVPHALFKELGTVSGRPLAPGRYIKDIVIVTFAKGTTAATCKAAFDAVGGTVVGGSRYRESPNEGRYYVRVTGGTASSLLRAVVILQGLPHVSASDWAVTPLDLESSRSSPKSRGLHKRSWRPS